MKVFLWPVLVPALLASGRETLDCEKVFSYYSVQTYKAGQRPLDLNFRAFSPLNHKVQVVIDSPPTSSFGYPPGSAHHDGGTLYAPSMTYCKYGYEEDILGLPLPYPHQVNPACRKKPALLVLPTTQKIPQHVPIAQIRYHVKDLVDGTRSCPGIVHVLNQEKMLTASVFDRDREGWTIERNGHAIVPPAHDTASMGDLNDFIHARDREIFLDTAGLDTTLWQFVAPAKFLGDFAVAYGGSLSFTIATTTGPFVKTTSGKNFNNDPTLPQTHSDGGNLPVVTLECATCIVTREDTNEGTQGEYGVRLVFPLSKLPLLWANKRTSATVKIPLKANAGWLIDPRNANHDWTPPTKCEFATVLHRVSKWSIMGDYSPLVETVALDDVKVRAGGSPPTECHRLMFPQANYKPKQRTGPPPSATFSFQPVTKTISFEAQGSLCASQPQGEIQSIFLQECSEYLSKHRVKCVKVTCGSVVVTLQGPSDGILKSTKEIMESGLKLPSFPTLKLTQTAL